MSSFVLQVRKPSAPSGGVEIGSQAHAIPIPAAKPSSSRSARNPHHRDCVATPVSSPPQDKRRHERNTRFTRGGDRKPLDARGPLDDGLQRTHGILDRSDTPVGSNASSNVQPIQSRKHGHCRSTISETIL
jgi:hypothetical protein